MDSDIQKKIKEITASVEQRSKRYRRSMITTGVIYAILVLFVFGYTTYIYRQITTLTTPENLSQFVVNSIRAQFPTVREGAREKMPSAAATVAREVVAGGLSMIPNAGTYARASVDEQVNSLLADFDKNEMPVIESALDQALAEVLAGDGAKDPDTISQEVNARVSKKVGDELDKVINGDFYSTIGNLQSDLDKLREKDPNTLTSRDFSERKFIFCWLRLNDISEVGESETSFLSTVSSLSNSVSKNLKKEAE